MSIESGAVLTENEEGTDQDSSAAMTMEDYLHFEEEAFKTPNHGDIVDGIVVRVDPDEVLVDIGAKAEGVISSKELGMRGDVDSELEPGDQIKVYVLQPENEEGNVVLSLRRARAETTWLVAAEKQVDGTVIDADVREQNKGGLIVNILGLRGFLPSSQVARAYAGSLESLVGKRIPIHARIVALADVFDALTHGRPYAPAWPIDKALEEIQAKRGTQFDPDLTDRFIELVRRLQTEHRDLDEYLGRAGRNSPFAQARNRIRLMLEEGRERIENQAAPASQTIH